MAKALEIEALFSLLSSHIQQNLHFVKPQIESIDVKSFSHNQLDTAAGSQPASRNTFYGHHEQSRILVTLPTVSKLSETDQNLFDHIQQRLTQVDSSQKSALRDMIEDLRINPPDIKEHQPSNSRHNFRSRLWDDVKREVEKAFAAETYPPSAISTPSNTKESQPLDSTDGSLDEQSMLEFLHIFMEIAVALFFPAILMIHSCEDNTRLITIIYEIMFSAAYGGIHLAAWSSVFPTSTEQIIWRVACMIIISSLPVLLLLLLCGKAAKHVTKTLTTKMRWLSPVAEFIETSGRVLFIATTLAATLLVISSRCFVFIESFISLRTSPIGVYWTPAWIQMLPHL